MLQCSFLQRATFFFLFTIIRLPACSPCCCRLRCLHSCISVRLHVCACSSFASGQEYSPHSTSSSARQPSTAVIGKVQGSDCNQSRRSFKLISQRHLLKISEKSASQRLLGGLGVALAVLTQVFCTTMVVHFTFSLFLFLLAVKNLTNCIFL